MPARTPLPHSMRMLFFRMGTGPSNLATPLQRMQVVGTVHVTLYAPCKACSSQTYLRRPT